MQVKAIEVQGIWYLISDQNSIVHSYYTKSYYLFKGQVTKEMSLSDISLGSQNYLVIAQSKQVYKGIPLFTHPWVDDVEALAEELNPYPIGSNWSDEVIIDTNRRYLVNGYNLAKEKYKYTQEDMIEAMRQSSLYMFNSFGIKKYIEKSYQPCTYLVEIEQKGDVVTVLKYSKI